MIMFLVSSACYENNTFFTALRAGETAEMRTFDPSHVTVHNEPFKQGFLNVQSTLDMLNANLSNIHTDILDSIESPVSVFLLHLSGKRHRPTADWRRQFRHYLNSTSYELIENLKALFGVFFRRIKHVVRLMFIVENF
ncbi:unnamed protein product [Soboliphyme baturini]|uniref:Secreted protein n=1 Tax=Soboliphyme baturini TaxID=241478 RepID=A0A183JA88_9BILA|nr:unnamed protein product [Soboliphyme baturini]